MNSFLSNLSLFVIWIVGLTDWSAQTPHGNEINNYGGYVLYLKNGTELDQLGEWYFYKDRVIGRLGETGWIGDTLGYFVVHESTFQIDTFQYKTDWDAFLDKHQLKPQIWTRWYHIDWTYFDEDFFLFYFFYFFFTVPLTFWYFHMLYKMLLKWQWNLRQPSVIIMLVLTIGILALYLLERFPQSI